MLWYAGEVCHTFSMALPRAIPRNKVPVHRKVVSVVAQKRKYIVLTVIVLLMGVLLLTVFRYSFREVLVVYHGAISQECVEKEKLELEVKQEPALGLILGLVTSRFVEEYNCIAALRYFPESLDSVRVELTSYDPVLAVIVSEMDETYSQQTAYSLFANPAKSEKVRYARTDGKLMDFSQSLPLPRIHYRVTSASDNKMIVLTKSSVQFLLNLSAFFSELSGNNPRLELTESGLVRVSNADIAALYMNLDKDLMLQLQTYKTILEHEKSLGRTPQRIDVRYRDAIVL